MQPSFLNLNNGRRLAYHLTEGKTPGVVFCGGFRSDMTGSKATSLEAFCRAQGRRFLRFDYTGHGQSSGDFMQLHIGSWKQDAVDIITHLAPGENIIVGSSMGGWVMLLASLSMPEKVRGLLGIASAPDFTEDLIWKLFTPEKRHEMMQKGVVFAPNCYGNDPYPLTKTLIEEGRKHLLLEKQIPLSCPVRLIHGTADEDVPWQVSEKLMHRLHSTDVRLTLLKNAGHRLSEPHELAVIHAALAELL
ncbi:MAG: alpha/beta hydrolase [Rickettsiales bacterium]|nr:alpha/beta hydrolase [Rickettsiales bacterium]